MEMLHTATVFETWFWNSVVHNLGSLKNGSEAGLLFTQPSLTANVLLESLVYILE